MPARLQASRSDAIVLAVMAMMGKDCNPSSARIFRVAVQPSITGMCMSISTASKGTSAPTTAS